MPGRATRRRADASWSITPPLFTGLRRLGRARRETQRLERGRPARLHHADRSRKGGRDARAPVPCWVALARPSLSTYRLRQFTTSGAIRGSGRK
jgi:hypothetical protein